MSDYPPVLEKMMSIWNSDDPNFIRSTSEDIFEPEFHFVDPIYNIFGVDAFVDMVHAVHNQIPGAVYSHVGDFDTHNDLYRYHWAIHLNDKLIMPGFDVTEIGKSGKIAKVIGFFGKFPRPD